jgi:hypothetical protein
MARGPCTFKQQDVTRALRATIAAGVEVARVEIEASGKIVLVTGKASEPAAEQGPTNNEWDGVEK